MTDGKEMGFFDHLDELRGRLVKSLILWVLVFCVCFYFHKQIFAFLAEPYLSLDERNARGMEILAGVPVEMPAEVPIDTPVAPEAQTPRRRS